MRLLTKYQSTKDKRGSLRYLFANIKVCINIMCFGFDCLSKYKCDEFKENSFSACEICSVNGDCEECEHSEYRGDGVLICTWYVDMLGGE